MAAPRAWGSLSDSYRSRLLGAARSGRLTGTKVTGSKSRVEAAARKAYEGGATQGGAGTRARGHAQAAYVNRPSTAAPKKATEREALQMGDAKTMADLDKWRRKAPSQGGPPKWIPRDPTKMGTDVAAILSQVDIPPAKWKSVRYTWLPTGSAIVTITPKRGRERSIILPDYSATREFGMLLKDPARMGSSDAESRRLAEAWGRPPGEGIEVEAPVNSPTPGSVAA